MGYESRIVIGEAGGDQRSLTEPSAVWLWDIARFELGKMGYDNAWADLLDRHPYPESPSYYYIADDGNTEVLTDRYGKWLKPLPIDETIQALKNLPEMRMWGASMACLAALEALNGTKTRMRGNHWVAVQYGY